jgi:hypothetical protein
MRGWGRHDSAPSWQSIRDRFGNIARQGRFQISDQDLQNLKYTIWGLAEASQKRLEASIEVTLPYLANL